MWDDVVSELVALGIAKRIDGPALLAMCELWGWYRAAAAVADEDPLDGNARRAVTGYYEKWQAAASKFGLNPADRDRLRLRLTEEGNPLAKYGIIG